jgi:hypothetical protein
MSSTFDQASKEPGTLYRPGDRVRFVGNPIPVHNPDTEFVVAAYAWPWVFILNEESGDRYSAGAQFVAPAR